MAHLLRDDRKNAIQAFMEVPGSRVDFDVSTSEDEVFQPTLGGTPRLYAVRSAVKIAIVGHNSSHVFDFASEPYLEAAEQLLIRLDGSRRDRITMRAVASPGTVSITEVDND